MTTAQLAAWLEPRVVRDSKGKMTPQYGKLDGEGQFIFVRPGTQAGTSTSAPPAVIRLNETRWRATDQKGEWEVLFEPGGNLRYYRSGIAVPVPGRWTQTDNTVSFDINAYSQRQGTIRDDTIEATATAKDGQRWRETLTRIR